MRISRERVEDRQVERERLAGSRAGRHADVLTAPGRVPRGPLMGVEALDADRGAHRRRQAVRELDQSRFPWALRPEVGELLALEQPLEAEDVDAHARARSAIATG